MDTLNVRPYVKPLGRTDLLACPLGFGGYRISEGNALHEAALRAYLDRGGNLLDTSANYADGHSEQIAAPYIVWPIQQKLATVQEAIGAQSGWAEWQHGCIETINTLLGQIHDYLSVLQQPTSDRVRRRLIRSGYSETLPPEPLSQMAIRVLLSLPGLSSVLVGMRRPAYVNDLMDLPSCRQLDGEAMLRCFVANNNPGAHR